MSRASLDELGLALLEKEDERDLGERADRRCTNPGQRGDQIQSDEQDQICTWIIPSILVNAKAARRRECGKRVVRWEVPAGIECGKHARGMDTDRLQLGGVQLPRCCISFGLVRPHIAYDGCDHDRGPDGAWQRGTPCVGRNDGAVCRWWQHRMREGHWGRPPEHVAGAGELFENLNDAFIAVTWAGETGFISTTATATAIYRLPQFVELCLHLRQLCLNSVANSIVIIERGVGLHRLHVKLMHADGSMGGWYKAKTDELVAVSETVRHVEYVKGGL